MDPITLSLLIGGGISLIGTGAGLVGNFMSNKQAAQYSEEDAQRQFEYQQQLMADQYKYNNRIQQNAQDFSNQQLTKQQQFAWDMFNKTNEYNTQSAIDDRLRAAGRNPYLYGASSVGATATQTGSFSSAGQGSVGLGSAAGIQTRYTPASAILQNFANMGYQLPMQAEQLKLVRENAREKNISNKFKEMDIMLDLKKKMADTKNVELRNYYQKVANMFANDMFEQDYLNKLETNKNLKLQGQSMGYTIAALAMQNEFLPQQLKLDVAMKNAELFTEFQRGNLTKSQYKHELIKTMISKENVKGAKLDNEGKQIANYKAALDYSTASEIAGYIVRKAEAEAEMTENNKYPRDWWQESFQKPFGSMYRGFGYGSEVVSPFKFK